MPRLIEYDTPAGKVLISVPSAPGVEAVGVLEKVVQASSQSFNAAFGVVTAVSRTARSALAAAQVQEAELEFSLQITTEGDLYIASGKTDAAMKVTLKIAPTNGDK